MPSEPPRAVPHDATTVDSGSIRRIHDGIAPNLMAVLNHYDQLFGFNLTAAQKADLVELLKSPLGGSNAQFRRLGLERYVPECPNREDVSSLRRCANGNRIRDGHQNE